MPLVTFLALLFSRAALVDTPSLEPSNCFVAPATGPLTAMTLYNEFGSALMAVLHVPIGEEPLVRLIGGGGFQPLSWDWASMIGFLLSLLYFVMLCCWLASAPSLAQSSASAASELTTVSTFDTPALPSFSSVFTGLSSSLSPSSVFSDLTTTLKPFRSQTWDSEEAVPLSFSFLLQRPSFAQAYPASAGLRTMVAYNQYVLMQQRVNNFADGIEHHLVNEMLPFPPTPTFARSRAITIVPFYVYNSPYRQYVELAPEINEFADDMERRYDELFPSLSTTYTA